MGEFAGEFEVINDPLGNSLVQTRNACIIERIKATAQCIIVDMRSLNPLANQSRNRLIIKNLTIHMQRSTCKPLTFNSIAVKI